MRKPLPVESSALSEEQMALGALLHMPESITSDQISEELAILAAIRSGEAAANVGRVVTHEEVVRRPATWTPKWCTIRRAIGSAKKGICL